MNHRTFPAKELPVGKTAVKKFSWPSLRNAKPSHVIVGAIGLVVGMTLVGVASANPSSTSVSSSSTSLSSPGDSLSKKTRPTVPPTSKKAIAEDPGSDPTLPLQIAPILTSPTTLPSIGSTTTTTILVAPTEVPEIVSGGAVNSVVADVATEAPKSCTQTAPGAPAGAYTVQPGDLFGTLASGHGLSVLQLATWNPQIGDPASITACQDWLVFTAPVATPRPTSAPVASSRMEEASAKPPTISQISKDTAADSNASWCPRSKPVGPDGAYVVKQGDNFWRIARKIHPGVADDNYWLIKEVQKMIDNNQGWIANPNQLCPGDRLAI